MIINPKEAPDGFHAARPLISQGSCHGCHWEDDAYDKCRKKKCVPPMRQDALSVIFVANDK
jgi:hypothetical protein